MSQPVPRMIGKYRVVRTLGKGAMGMVFEGYDPVIERRVAIKTILAEYLEAAEMEEAQARFKREAQASGRLQHPGIVGVYEYGEDDGMAFIVMEYVEGQELKGFFREGRRFELIDVFEIMKQLLAALDYSHRQGVIHRDIKPANLMVQPGPKVKIMDFGIARLESSSLTQVGTVVGTPTHMAPEQLMGITADGRADLWSAGVILYELLTGISPFLAETPAGVMHKVLQGTPDAPSTINPMLPAGFDGVVARALAKKAEDRFAGAKEFQGAMLQALQGRAVAGVTARRDPERTLSPADAVKAQTSRDPSTTSARKRRPLEVAPEVLAELERSLSRHIGPLARHLIKEGQAESRTLQEFCERLAGHIEGEADRTDFLSKVSKLHLREKPAEKPAPDATTTSRRTESASGGKAFTRDALATAERRLASYVGPLARFLIKDAAAQSSGDLKELYRQLAQHIDSDEERRDFLAVLDR